MDWANRLGARGQKLVYVVDGGPSTLLWFAMCPIIVFTSTDKGGIRDLKKYPQRHQLWMYAWTLPELEACRSKIPAYQQIELPLLTALWEVCFMLCCQIGFQSCEFIVCLACEMLLNI